MILIVKNKIFFSYVREFKELFFANFSHLNVFFSLDNGWLFSHEAGHCIGGMHLRPSGGYHKIYISIWNFQVLDLKCSCRNLVLLTFMNIWNMSLEECYGFIFQMPLKLSIQSRRILYKYRLYWIKNELCILSAEWGIRHHWSLRLELCPRTKWGGQRKGTVLE